MDKVKLTEFAENQSLESYLNNLKKYFQPPLKPKEKLEFANGELSVNVTLENQMKMVLFHTSMQQVG